MKNILKLTLALALVMGQMACATTGGPALNSQSRGPAIDKSGDGTLRTLVAEVAPRFKQDQFKTGDITLQYNLFTPEKMEKGKKYPLVVFMADASTPGRDVAAPLTQGYGALVFATAEAQEKNPCYVLVPQFSGVTVNDSYEKTPEVDAVIALIKDVVKSENIDPARIYSTGQSMGGMMSMYYDVAYPEMFAASLFVDCHWDPATMAKLVDKKFIFATAGTKGKSAATVGAIEEAARKARRSYTTASWSARLPLDTQDGLAQTMLDKGAPINIFTFEDGTVLPEGVKGSEHMYSFDCAYKIAPVREWLFKQVGK